VDILREVAHLLVPDPDPARRPSAEEAQDTFAAYLVALQLPTPPTDLSPPTPTPDFVDHLVALSGRYGPYLFVCYQDSRVPATTNELEGFFGDSKHHDRRALGCGSTTQSPVHNLGADYLLGLHLVRFAQRAGDGSGFPEPAMEIDPAAYRKARSELRQPEEPARERRRGVRSLPNCLKTLLDRWSPSSG
jgi:hypothetical protein